MNNNEYESVKDAVFRYIRDHLRYGLTVDDLERMLDELKEKIKQCK